MAEVWLYNTEIFIQFIEKNLKIVYIKLTTNLLQSSFLI